MLKLVEDAPKPVDKCRVWTSVQTLYDNHFNVFISLDDVVAYVPVSAIGVLSNEVNTTLRTLLEGRVITPDTDCPAGFPRRTVTLTIGLRHVRVLILPAGQWDLPSYPLH